MIVLVGLVLLVAAGIAAVAGVLTNSGHAHPVTHFAVLGYHVTGSTGTLFLYGIVVGAVAMLGLGLLLAGARRTSRRGRDARRGLAQSRRETAAVSADRDDLIGQRDTARSYTASTLSNGNGNSNGNGAHQAGHGRRDRRPGLFTRRSARQAAPQAGPAPQPEPLPGQPAADVPAAASASAE